jgi:hypothetical protein
MNALHYLIEMRIDLNHANNDGLTPLMLASLQVFLSLINNIHYHHNNIYIYIYIY